MRRAIIAACSCLLISLGWFHGEALAQVTISGPFNFTDNRGPNSLGFSVGGRLVFGAISITPSGTLTTATATQGSTSLPLIFDPTPLFPNQYDRSIPFDPSLTGSWTINAMRSGVLATPVLTNPIPVPRLLPLVHNLDVEGTGLTPTLTWELPDLTGMSVEIRIRAFRATTREQFFSSAPLGATATTFTIPSGVLQDGQSYVFRVMLRELATLPQFGTVEVNRSSTFTQCVTAPLTALTNFISSIYCEVLERAPEPAGLAAWAAFLRANCNAQGFDAIARGFFDSLEFRTAKPHSLEGLVTLLYRTFLGREPDPGGLAGWAGLVRQARLTMALQGFIPSQEFQSLLPDRTNRAAVTAVVTRLYQQVLGRQPEPAGLQGWVDFIVTTGRLEDAAQGFLASQEFESHSQTARDYVTTLYRTFLNRDPEPAGLDGWEGVLRNTLLQVINTGFVPSQEFQGLVPQVCG